MKYLVYVFILNNKNHNYRLKYKNLILIFMLIYLFSQKGIKTTIN